jgi:reverse transcriptase-like protein
MQGDLSRGSTYHVHGRSNISSLAGKPDALKGACPVWREAHGTGPLVKWYLAGCLPYGDISKCFDTLDHQVMMSILKEKLHDNRFLRLIQNLLQAGYLEDWRYTATLSGCPQGGVISPILSNIYLDKLDKFVEQNLLPEYNHKQNRQGNRRYNTISSLASYYRRHGRHDKAETPRIAQRDC